MQMADGRAYLFRGYGTIDPAWMRECFQLFKARGVNIRKLLLLRDGAPERAMLEIQFVIPAEEQAFLDDLDGRLSRLTWSVRDLQPL